MRLCLSAWIPFVRHTWAYAKLVPGTDFQPSARSLSLSSERSGLARLCDCEQSASFGPAGNRWIGSYEFAMWANFSRAIGRQSSVTPAKPAQGRPSSSCVRRTRRRRHRRRMSMKNHHGKWVNLPLLSTKKASPSVSSRDHEDTRKVEQSSNVASLREAVSSLRSKNRQLRGLTGRAVRRVDNPISGRVV